MATMTLDEARELKRRREHINYQALSCLKQAQSMMGTGWKHISQDMQWALVAERILMLYLGQSASNDQQKVRDYIEGVTERAHELLEE